MTLKPLSPDKEAQIPLHLINQIRSGNATLFVGSGLSIPLGYPSWKGLVERIYQGVESTRPIRDEGDRKWIGNTFASQPDWVAEVIQYVSTDLYAQVIRQIFSKQRHDKISLNHVFSSLIPFHSYLTTNYDSLIESYLGAFYGRDVQVFDHVDALSNYAEYKLSPKSVLKLHGCANKNLDNLVLTSSQYYRLLQDQRYIRLLSSIFSEQTILTIGFSLRDRDFRFFLEERHHLYHERCPPMYAVVSDRETCTIESTVLRDRYNVVLLRVSPDHGFSELTQFLYSLYCLVYRENSSNQDGSLIHCAARKASDQGLGAYREVFTEPTNLISAKELLSVFREPIRLDAFIAVCLENDIRVSAAELLTVLDQDCDGRVLLRRNNGPHSEHVRVIAAKWIATELEGIPVTDSPRHFASYHKLLFSRYASTMASLLVFPECWREIVGSDDKSSYRFNRINQYFKQEGRWGDWLSIAEAAAVFLDRQSPIYRLVLQSMLWVYFWTRRFDKASELIADFPELDDKGGEHNYSDRLKYMNRAHLPSLIDELEKRPNPDYFAKSILGRSYAQLFLGDRSNKAHLLNAKKWLSEAKAEATDKGDWIERSVQSWYLSIVLADIGEIDNAVSHLSEVKRLDESIMNRIPGLAWLDLAQYRIACSDGSASEYRLSELKNKAIESFERLGVVDVENYIDREYYY